MKQLKFVIAIILIVLVIILIVQNHSALSTSVHFRFDLFSLHYQSIEMSIYFIIPAAFILGVIVMALCNISEKIGFKRQIKMLENESKQKSKELNSLRNLPITSDNVVSDHLNGNDEYA